MKKYILIKKYGPQLEAEHISKQICEKFLFILKVFVNIPFHVQFFVSILPELSCLLINDTIQINVCKIFFPNIDE
jgi:hypothetical protein